MGKCSCQLNGWCWGTSAACENRVWVPQGVWIGGCSSHLHMALDIPLCPRQLRGGLSAGTARALETPPSSHSTAAVRKREGPWHRHARFLVEMLVGSTHELPVLLLRCRVFKSRCPLAILISVEHENPESGSRRALLGLTPWCQEGEARG